MTERTKPSITIPEGEPPAELLIEDEIVGDGDEAVVGKRVIVHYAGVAWSTGREFDASWNRGDTFDFLNLEGLLSGKKLFLKRYMFISAKYFPFLHIT